MQRKLLVLDIDETLIYSTKIILNRQEDFRVGDYFVYKRPSLEDFFLGIEQWFKIAIWTASSEDYARQVLNNILPPVVNPEFIFTQNRCNFRFNHEIGEKQIIKPIKKIRRKGFSKKEILIIDDLPETFQQNYGNAILVKKFCGLETDNELSILLTYLKTLVNVDDVRKLDKRNWRYKTIISKK